MSYENYNGLANGINNIFQGLANRHIAKKQAEMKLVEDNKNFALTQQQKLEKQQEKKNDFLQEKDLLLLKLNNQKNIAGIKAKANAHSKAPKDTRNSEIGRVFNLGLNDFNKDDIGKLNKTQAIINRASGSTNVEVRDMFMDFNKNTGNIFGKDDFSDMSVLDINQYEEITKQFAEKNKIDMYNPNFFEKARSQVRNKQRIKELQFQSDSTLNPFD